MKPVDGRLYRHDGKQLCRAVPATCQYCGSEFLALVKEVKKGGGRFCSRDCSRTHQAKVNAANRRKASIPVRERRKSWKERTSPLVLIAHKAVASAISKGQLKRMPCEQCGAEKVDAHHDDYSKPLDVRWLCRSHHLQFHRQNKSAALNAKPPSMTATHD